MSKIIENIVLFSHCLACLTRYATWSREAVCAKCARRERDAAVEAIRNPPTPPRESPAR